METSLLAEFTGQTAGIAALAWLAVRVFEKWIPGNFRLLAAWVFGFGLAAVLMLALAEEFTVAGFAQGFLAGLSATGADQARGAVVRALKIG